MLILCFKNLSALFLINKQSTVSVKHLHCNHKINWIPMPVWYKVLNHVATWFNMCHLAIVTRCFTETSDLVHCSHICKSVPPNNFWTNSHKTFYEHVTRGHPSFVLFYFLLVFVTWAHANCWYDSVITITINILGQDSKFLCGNKA